MIATDWVVTCEGCKGNFEGAEVSDEGYCESCEYALCEMLSARDDELFKAVHCE